MSDAQPALPTFEAGPVALVPGPVFLCFELRGKPPHKGRHRSRIVYPKAGKPFIANYPDPATAAHEAVIAEYGKLMMRGKAPTEKPVCLLVHSFRVVPESWSRRDRAAALAGAILPTSKPDWDNYGKITDALNGIAWKDDSQVCDGRVIKRYSEQPGLRIEIREFVTP